MSLDAKTVTHVARLARIGLQPYEIESLGKDMGGIIEWVEQLAEVDVSGVPPMVGTGLATLRLRDDRVTDGYCREAVLSNAPDRAPGENGAFFTVPKVVE